MNTVVAIKGTNGSGKSTVVRELIACLEKQSILRVNSKEAGYRCKYEDGSLFVLGKYQTAACGGLDSSFSYGGAADDLLLCIDKLAPQGHVVCEGVIADHVVWIRQGDAIRNQVKEERSPDDLRPHRHACRIVYRASEATQAGSRESKAF